MKGQVSIEFLLVFVAMLAFISVFVGAFSTLHESSLLSLDIQNAKRFVKELDNSSKTLLLLGDGSNKKFSYTILTSWELKEIENNNFLIIDSKEKDVQLELPKNIKLKNQNSFSKKFRVTLTKTSDELILD